MSSTRLLIHCLASSLTNSNIIRGILGLRGPAVTKIKQIYYFLSLGWTTMCVPLSSVSFQKHATRLKIIRLCFSIVTRRHIYRKQGYLIQQILNKKQDQQQLSNS